MTALLDQAKVEVNDDSAAARRTSADLSYAQSERARLRLACSVRDHLTEDDVWAEARRAARSVARMASPAELDALASEVAERAIARHGSYVGGRWLVPAGAITRKWLSYRVSNALRDSQVWRDTLDSHERARRDADKRADRAVLSFDATPDLLAEAVAGDVEAPTWDVHGWADALELAHATARRLTALDTDNVAAALAAGMTDRETPALATAAGISSAAMRKRVQRGMQTLRDVKLADIREALMDAADALGYSAMRTLERIAATDRVDLAPVALAAMEAVNRAGHGTATYRAAKRPEREARLSDGQVHAVKVTRMAVTLAD